MGRREVRRREGGGERQKEGEREREGGREGGREGVPGLGRVVGGGERRRV